MKTDFEKKIGALYRKSYQKSESAFDELMDRKLLKSFAKIKNTGIRISETDDMSYIPFMHFYLSQKDSEKIFEDATKDMKYYRVWNKLYLDCEIEEMTDEDSKKYARECADAWNEYKEFMKSVPEDEYELVSDELMSGKYEKYTHERNYEVESLSFNYYLGPTPNSSWKTYCKNREDFLKLLRDNTQDNFNFKNTYTVEDVKQLCEKFGIGYSRDIVVAVLWFANIMNNRQLYKDSNSKLTYYKNY